MYCEKAQKECAYLDVIRQADEARLFASIEHDDSEVDSCIIEAVDSFNKMAVAACLGEESCGAIKAAIAASILSSAELRQIN